MFLKDRQVSSFGCFVFDFCVLRFRVLGASCSSLGCFVFESWVLRFRDLGASFSSLGCFVFEIWVLRASVFFFECFVFKTTVFIHQINKQAENRDVNYREFFGYFTQLAETSLFKQCNPSS